MILKQNFYLGSGVFCKTSKAQFKRDLKESKWVSLLETSYCNQGNAHLPERRTFSRVGRDDCGEYIEFLLGPRNYSYATLTKLEVFQSDSLIIDGRKVEGNFYCLYEKYPLQDVGYPVYLLYEVVK